MRFIGVIFCCLAVAGCSGVSNTSAPWARPSIDGTLAFDAAKRSLPSSRQALDALSTYSIVHTFGTQSGGNYPAAGLTAVNGVLYGTTEFGGDGYGTIFSITPAGNLSTLFTFEYGSDGQNPAADLLNVNGTLYGTSSGGSTGYGSVFGITTSGSFFVLHHFAGGADGANPFAALTYVNGTLYGTTANGGSGTACGASGCGTVFEVALPSFQETVLHSFQGGSDGAIPKAALTNVNGTLYGTTSGGGTAGKGTAFSIASAGQERVVYSFKGGPTDGADPEAPLTYTNGRLYGTTSGGGSATCTDGQECGTVFSLSASGNEKVVHFFDSSDGGVPAAGLADVNGKLFSTISGGLLNCGAVFSMTTSGVVSLLHNFQGHGCQPHAGVTYLNGAFYGTTTGVVHAHTINGGAIYKLLHQ